MGDASDGDDEESTAADVISTGRNHSGRERARGEDRWRVDPHESSNLSPCGSPDARDRDADHTSAESHSSDDDASDAAAFSDEDHVLTAGEKRLLDTDDSQLVVQLTQNLYSYIYT